MAEENKGTGGQASVASEAGPRPYELKQVQVRLRLSEAGSIYSTKEITNHVRAAEVMSDVLAQMDREYVCVVNLDIKNRPINFNIVSIGDIDGCDCAASEHLQERYFVQLSPYHADAQSS